MPEGHTLHRIARDHGRLIGGRQIAVSSPQGRFAADATRVDGATLERIEAYGKHLFHWWSTGDVGHIHLGLFGRFRVHLTDDPPAPVGMVRMRMSTSDVTIDLAGPNACTLGSPDERAAIVARLGPDPLRRDAVPAAAITAMARSRRPIAALLLDQSVLAGVGNVYRAEVLFVCGIHPLRPGIECSAEELQRVWHTTTTMLRAGFKANRIVTVSREEVGIPKGRRITRADAMYVYQRDRCIRCGDEIRAVTVGNRLCYYCPTDQPH